MCSVAAPPTRDMQTARILSDILRDLEEAKASLEYIGDARHLCAIRKKTKSLLVLPREKSEAEKEAHRLSQQKFYRRKKEEILDKRRRQRNRDKQSEKTYT